MIIVADLHLKHNEAHWKGQKKFLDWLSDNFDRETMLFLGDCFDSSAPKWKVYSYFKEFLKNRRGFNYIVQGNHDRSAIKGSSLEGLHLMDNVRVFFKPEEFESKDGFKCMAIPYDCGDDPIEFKGDFCFAHIVPVQESFGKEFTDLTKIDATILLGHIHLKDNYGENIKVLGVHVPSRHLEVTNPIIKINDDKRIEEIEVPEFLKYETIKFGDTIENPDFIYNVHEAPDIPSVFEKYKGYYIRTDGIKKKRTENELVFDSKISDEDYKGQFKIFCEEEDISKEIFETVIGYMK